MELGATLRAVRDELDRLDGALNQDLIQSTAAKEAISKSIVKETKLKERIRSQSEEYARAQQHKEFAEARLAASSGLRDGASSTSTHPRVVVEEMQKQVLGEMDSFMEECRLFGMRYSENGFSEQEMEFEKSEKQIAEDLLRLEKRKESFVRREAHLDGQLSHEKVILSRAAAENRKLHESVRIMRSTHGGVDREIEQTNKHISHLKSSLDGLHHELSTLQQTLASKHTKLQDVRNERARKRQSIEKAKIKRSSITTQSVRKKQNGASKDGGKKTKASSPETNSTVMEMDLFGGIRHHHL